jgi:hypothetical protein
MNKINDDRIPEGWIIYENPAPYAHDTRFEGVIYTFQLDGRYLSGKQESSFDLTHLIPKTVTKYVNLSLQGTTRVEGDMYDSKEDAELAASGGNLVRIAVPIEVEGE